MILLLLVLFLLTDQLCCNAGSVWIDGERKKKERNVLSPRLFYNSAAAVVYQVSHQVLQGVKR